MLFMLEPQFLLDLYPFHRTFHDLQNPNHFPGDFPGNFLGSAKTLARVLNFLIFQMDARLQTLPLSPSRPSQSSFYFSSWN
jgi:hypothetical protein